VQAQYQLEKNTNLRLNYSQGISRPNVGDLVPITIVDPNTSPKTVTEGNRHNAETDQGQQLRHLARALLPATRHHPRRILLQTVV